MSCNIDFDILVIMQLVKLKICDGKKHKTKFGIQNQEKQKKLHAIGRPQGRAPIFPNNLAKVGPFPIWIRVAISSVIKDGVTIDKEVMHMSMPSTLEATTHRTMYAFANHLQVSSGEDHLTTSYCGIVATF
jgi:hypothetical protein